MLSPYQKLLSQTLLLFAHKVSHTHSLMQNSLSLSLIYKPLSLYFSLLLIYKEISLSDSHIQTPLSLSLWCKDISPSHYLILIYKHLSLSLSLSDAKTSLPLTLMLINKDCSYSLTLFLSLLCKDTPLSFPNPLSSLVETFNLSFPPKRFLTSPFDDFDSPTPDSFCNLTFHMQSLFKCMLLFAHVSRLVGGYVSW